MSLGKALFNNQLCQIMGETCLFINSRKLSEIVQSRMRTWQIYNYGKVQQLTKTNSHNTPALSSPNHVLIKIKAASVNPMDLKLIDGYGSSLFPLIRQVNGKPEFPIRPGRDFSGHVVKVGRSVTRWTPGAAVMGALWPFQDGSMADYVVCCESQLARKPANISFAEAASLPYAGLTVYSSLIEFGNLKAGNAVDKKVLIIGSSGGMGTIGVQLVKSLGAYVAVICREDSAQMMLDLGADAIHGNANSPLDSKYDVILDCVGDQPHNYAGLLKPGCGSRYVTVRHSLIRLTDQFSPLLGLPIAGADFFCNLITNAANTGGSIYQWAFFRASGQNLSVIADIVESGSLRPMLDSTFRFEQVPDAFERLDRGGVRGKVVVNMDDLETSSSS